MFTQVRLLAVDVLLFVEVVFGKLSKIVSFIKLLTFCQFKVVAMIATAVLRVGLTRADLKCFEK